MQKHERRAHQSQGAHLKAAHTPPDHGFKKNFRRSVN